MPAPVIETDGESIVLDLSAGATLLGQPIAGLDVRALSALIDRAMAEAGTGFAFGRYGEPRELYSTDLFGDDSGERRTIHLGVDLFCAAGTHVHTPEDGVVEYVANNDRELDYGPLVIVDHGDFRTLYGHLSLDTLGHVTPGQSVSAGERIARVGEPPTNGNWPPHLHFQRINDLVGQGVDFPGVAAKSEWDRWQSLSPSPHDFFPDVDPDQLRYSA